MEQQRVIQVGTVEAEDTSMDVVHTSGCGDAETEYNGKRATGRGDTDRLLTREKLRRVTHRAEGVRTKMLK
jgi:hypothetical protein